MTAHRDDGAGPEVLNHLAAQRDYLERTASSADTNPPTQADVHSPWAASPNRLLRVEDASEFLALSRATVYQLLASGELGSISIGRSRRIPLAALDAYVERLRQSSS